MDKGLLSRATDSTSAPTPGYLYNDIGKTLTSPQICIETTQFLVNRLSSKNPHIKKKCCKVLTKLIVHPTNRGMLKRTLSQNPNSISVIKECSVYRGQMDAVTGDQWNIEVREAAKECLEVIYSDSAESGDGGAATAANHFGMAGLNSNQQQPYGGGGYGAPMGGTSGTGFGSPVSSLPYGGSRMQGIGNPMFADPRLEQSTATTTVEKLSELATEMGGAVLEMIKDPLAKKVASMQQHPHVGTYGGPNMRPDPYCQPPGRNNLAMHTGGQWTMASNRGPNAIGGFGAPHPPADAAAPRHDESEYYKARNASGQAFHWASSSGSGGAAAGGGAPTSPARPAGGGVGGSWATVAPPPPPVSSPAPVSVAAQSRMDANQSSPYSRGVVLGGGGAVANGHVGSGTYEKDLIAELCPPGGMKAEPPEDKLADFAKAVPSLNPDLVCPALLDALEDGNPWIMRAKALCVIETVLKVMMEQGGGGEDSNNAYSDFFHACAGEIEPLAHHARQSVKGPARRVLALLGVVPGADVTASHPSINGASAASAATVVTEAPNLLDFDGDEVPPPPPPPTAASITSGGESMFSGMSMKGGGSVMPSPSQPLTNSPVAPALVSTESTEDSSGDLLGNFSISSDLPSSSDATRAVAAMSLGSNSLFGNMTLKSNNNTVESVAVPLADASSVVGPGSAFGFMNDTPAAGEVPKSSSSAASYDPLLTLGMTNNNNGTTTMKQTGTMNNVNPIAQMTPAQMQQMQMAYQQNMMMMQMQQMQMGGGSAYGRQGSNPNVMGANYMRQVPGVQGDNSSFSFLGAPKKKDSHEFDFVKDAMKRG